MGVRQLHYRNVKYVPTMTMAPAARIACQSFQPVLRYAIVHAAENTTMPISNVSQEMKSVSMIFPIVQGRSDRPREALHLAAKRSL